MVDIQKLLDIAEKLQEKDNLEKGQSFLSALAEMDPELAEEIKGTDSDPSLGEKNYMRFVNYLLTHNLRYERSHR